MRSRYSSGVAATMSLAGLTLFLSACSDTIAPNPSRIAPEGNPAFAVVTNLPGIPAGSTVINFASGPISDLTTAYCGYLNPYPATASNLQTTPGTMFNGSCGAPVDLTTALAAYNPGWSAPLAGSSWIGPVLIAGTNSIGTGTSNEYKPLPGDYTFRTTFTVPAGTTNRLLRLSLRSDNAVIVYLNNVPVGQNTIEDCNRSTATPCNWDTQINVTDASAFVTGLNTLRIDLVDTPAGLGFNAPGTYCYSFPPPSADGHFVTPYDLSKCANPAGVSFTGTVSFTPAPPVLLNDRGCSPGYWKNHSNWASPYTKNELFVTAFGVNAFPGETLQDVISDGGGGLTALGRATVSALLNAQSFGVNHYGETAAQVIADFAAVYGHSNQYDTLKAKFEAMQDVGGRSCF